MINYRCFDMKELFVFVHEGQWPAFVMYTDAMTVYVMFLFVFIRERKTGGLKMKGKDGKKPRRRHTDVRLIGKYCKFCKGLLSLCKM